MYSFLKAFLVLIFCTSLMLKPLQWNRSAYSS